MFPLPIAGALGKEEVVAISSCRQQENLNKNYVCFGVNCFFGRNQYSL